MLPSSFFKKGDTLKRLTGGDQQLQLIASQKSTKSKSETSSSTKESTKSYGGSAGDEDEEFPELGTPTSARGSTWSPELAQINLATAMHSIHLQALNLGMRKDWVLNEPVLVNRSLVAVNSDDNADFKYEKDPSVFAPGKILEFLPVHEWSGLTGNPKDAIFEVPCMPLKNGQFGKLVIQIPKRRIVVVVSKRPKHCTVLPVLSYGGGDGFDRKTMSPVEKKMHCIIVSSQDIPQLGGGYFPRDEERKQMGLETVTAILNGDTKHDMKHLDPLSMIHLGKPMNLECNELVRIRGYVEPKDFMKLQKMYMELVSQTDIQADGPETPFMEASLPVPAVSRPANRPESSGQKPGPNVGSSRGNLGPSQASNRGRRSELTSSSGLAREAEETSVHQRGRGLRGGVRGRGH